MSNSIDTRRATADRCPECTDDLTVDGTHTGGNYFGMCPTCRSNDGHINVGKAHWFFCQEHRVTWMVGVNLFSTWHGETEAEQRAQYDELGFETFTTIEPSYCSRLEAEFERYCSRVEFERSGSRVEAEFERSVSMAPGRSAGTDAPPF
jgi:hypothetical protein